MCMGPMMNNIANRDAISKAKGEPTNVFHNIRPNYSHPSISSLKESAPPPVLSSLSSGGSSSNLSIRRGSSSTRKRSTTSGRRTSKSKRFSTTR